MNATTRSAIVAEARSWLKTPFHHEARRKGVGVDCANLLIGVYAALGLIEEFTPDHYPQDWHLHKGEPRFLNLLLQYCDALPDGELPRPGDIAMFHYGHSDAHGSIVLAWPVVIHAWKDVGMVVETEADTGPLAKRLAGFYRLKGLE